MTQIEDYVNQQNPEDIINILDKGNWENASKYTVNIFNVGKACFTYIYVNYPKSRKQFKVIFDCGFQKVNEIKSDSSFTFCEEYCTQDSPNDNNIIFELALKRAAAFKPDLVILSHWHFDHYCLLESLNNEKDFMVIAPYFPPSQEQIINKQGIDIINRLMENNKIYFVKDSDDGLVYNSGGMFLYKTSSSNERKYLDKNALILTLRDVLLPGDCTYNEFPKLLEKRISEFSKFICTHHGNDIDSILSLLDIDSNRVRWGIVCTDASQKHPNHMQRIQYHQMNIGLIYLPALKYYKADKFYKDKQFYYSDEDSIKNMLLFDFTEEIGQNISNEQDFSKMTIGEVDNKIMDKFDISIGKYFDKITIKIK